MRRSAEVVLGSPVWGAAQDSNSFKSSMRQSGSLVLFRVYPADNETVQDLRMAPGQDQRHSTSQFDAWSRWCNATEGCHILYWCLNNTGEPRLPRRSLRMFGNLHHRLPSTLTCRRSRHPLAVSIDARIDHFTEATGSLNASSLDSWSIPVSSACGNGFWGP